MSYACKGYTIRIKYNMDVQKVEEVYDQHLRINKTLQIHSGLWPYRPIKEKLIRRTIVFIMMAIFIFPHINGMRTWCGKNMDLVLCGENFEGVLYLGVVTLKYYVTILSEPRIMQIHKQIAKNWSTLTDSEEQSILIKHSKQGKIVTILYLGFAFSQVSMVPVILDYIWPLNESRPKILIVHAEYIIDPLQYYFELYGAYCILTFVNLTVLISIDTAFSSIVYQNLGVFSIVKNRLNAVTKRPNEKKDNAYELIVGAIRLHNSALQFNDLIEMSYRKTFLIILGYTILFLSVGGVILIEQTNIMQFIRLAMIEVGVMIHLLYLSYPGQKVLDYSSSICQESYTNEWYLISKKSKILLKFMMLRCIKPSVLTAGGLYIMNYENYGIIIKTAMSYVAVLASFR
ncbi:odorant receptor 49b isoform X2 [Nasonia vitripennis]|uniref:Odorant receptor n=1 Tax=Nasonia vitripennis TaxID=7425 RepID=A0A7M7TBJ5_NASVI|nr:odorant receptor 49b isoform X2 [Nasonia vitripennis]